MTEHEYRTPQGNKYGDAPQEMEGMFAMETTGRGDSVVRSQLAKVIATMQAQIDGLEQEIEALYHDLRQTGHRERRVQDRLKAAETWIDELMEYLKDVDVAVEIPEKFGGKGGAGLHPDEVEAERYVRKIKDDPQA